MNSIEITKSIERGTFNLGSNTTVLLKKGVTVSASMNIDDYIADESIFKDTCGNELGRSLFYAKDCENITLLGEPNSVIDGKGYRWERGASKRPSLLRFVNCTNVTLKNLSLRNSPCWCVHLQNCQNVNIEGLSIISDSNSNNDGIDIDGCSFVTVDGCYIENGDDAVVIKSTKNICSKDVTIKNCALKTLGAGLKIGTETVGDISNVNFIDNTIIRANGCAIKIVPTDGSKVDGVCIKNIVAKEVTGPIFVANGTRMRKYYADQIKNTFSSISNILIENFVAEKVYNRSEEVVAPAKGVVFFSGTEQNRIRNVIVKNCVFNMPCLLDADTDFTVEEMGERYPEYYYLGTAPAYKFYVRHADNFIAENNVFNIDEKDVREKIVLDDVNNFKEC